MIRALEAVGLAWLMFNGALFVLLRRDQAMQIRRETIDRFKRAVGACEANRQPAPPMPARDGAELQTREAALLPLRLPPRPSQPDTELSHAHVDGPAAPLQALGDHGGASSIFR
jgi:hypothetical protein